ncbi:hypothetical protein P1X14_11110 [Sphingomonas sp. AOB5]|uniref:nSTAND1 domain-containing NTPase n=1 Tax=Sphingomonas sp. AOB5 TaxID=3034017 RepID=UPI0023F87B5A|nr:hypothetical protein [Sphingomonas sp. AOB5]MDF7775796.1 hypothetical protein [Sphingomonas sp. AOB5]
MITLDKFPYPGLRAFNREEAHLFFGREGCVDEMIDRLASTRFLAVLGASGSGKSSLVKTGLLSSLQLGFFARAGARWTIAEFTPGGQPMRNLAAALTEASDAPRKPSVDMLRALLARGPRALIEWCQSGALKPGHNLLILVDQFEELFRYGDYAAREEAEAFVHLLLESAKAAEVPIHIVLTMRSEYLGACALIPGLAEEINAGFYLTPRMSREECRAAIEGPAAIARFEIDPELVNQILNDMASFAPWEEQRGVAQGQSLSRRADQLPLMQHLLNRLWLRARARGEPVVLRMSDYDETDGLAGALNSHGAEILARLSPAARDEAGTVFRALVSGPDPTNAIRRPCRFDELAAQVKGGPAVAREIVEAFRAPDCNFLRPEATATLADDMLIDISHESLIRQWNTLAGWLQEEARAAANWHRLLLGTDRRASGEGGLLTGLDLASLAAWWDKEEPNKLWAARHGGRFEEAERFLGDSRAAEEEAQRRETARAATERKRLIQVVAVLAVLLLAAAGSLGMAWFQGRTIDSQREEIARNQANLEKQAAEKRRAEESASETLKQARIATARLREAEVSIAAARVQAENEKKQAADALAAVVRAREDLQGRLRDESKIAQRQRGIFRDNDRIAESVKDYCGGKMDEPACRTIYRNAARAN